MLRAEDFIKCREARILEIENQRKLENEQLIKDQLELVNKQLNEAYENMTKSVNVNIRYIEIQEKLLPEVIKELNKLGYWVTYLFNNGIVKNTTLYLEKPYYEKKLSLVWEDINVSYSSYTSNS